MRVDAGGGPPVGITNFQLKMIALITMIIDHAGLVFMGYHGVDLTLFRVIGRISFPLFAFLISEGCRHTRDFKQYLLRLFAFALISHAVFSAGRMIYEATFTGEYNPFLEMPAYNVFFTLLLGAASVFCYERIQELFEAESYAVKALSFVPFLAAMAVAEYCQSDYGALGVFLIFAAYVVNDKLWRLAVMFVGIAALYRAFFPMPLSFANVQSFIPYAGMLSLVFIYFYNGRKGKSMKWFFYAAYPGHLAVLGLIYFILTQLGV